MGREWKFFVKDLTQKPKSAEWFPAKAQSRKEKTQGGKPLLRLFLCGFAPLREMFLLTE
jgi:hypothetical protein